jgi:hypothetical protein
MALSSQVRRLLATALGDSGAANELANAIDASTSGDATQAGNNAFTGTNSHSGAETFTGGVTINTAGATITDVDVTLGTTTGTKIGTAAAQLLAFHGATPVAQRAGAAQAAVDATASTQTTPYGYASQAQADGVVTLLNEVRGALVEKGIIKGTA